MDIHRVEPGEKLDLDGIDPRATPGVKGKKTAEKLFEPLNGRLSELQNRLWAEHERKVLVVLQGMDTSGKDGTVKHVFSGVNPAGVRMTAFKQPTPEERRHAFLWRIRRALPQGNRAFGQRQFDPERRPIIAEIRRRDGSRRVSRA